MPLPVIAVFGSSRAKRGHPHYRLASAWGRIIAETGFAVATGGYGGTMEAVSQAVREAGGVVIGVTAPPVFPGRPGANAHVGLELPSPSLLSRIERLLDIARGYLALPGGVGTFTEIAAAWNRAYVDRLAGRPVRPLAVHVAWRTLLRPGLEIAPEDLELIHFIEDEADLRRFLRNLPR